MDNAIKCKCQRKKSYTIIIRWWLFLSSFSSVLNIRYNTSFFTITNLTLRELPALIFWNYVHFKQIYVSMLLCNIYKYTYYTNILLKMHQTANIYRDCDHTGKARRFIPRIQGHSIFIIQYVIYTLIILYFEI